MRCCCKKKDIEDRPGKHVKSGVWSLLFKITIWTFSILLSLLLVLLILLFVALPLVFQNNIELQRFLMFPNYDQPSNPEFTNYNKYDAEGVRNLYVSVDDLEDPSKKVSLGIWQVVPESKISESKSASFNYTKELEESTTDILIYFHGNSGTRIAPLQTYNVVRKFFHILAFDYRSYGDSTEALLTEKAVVNDAIQLFKWVVSKTNQKNIYIWGHSLGTALSTHTVKEIFNKRKPGDVLPKGLILEAPFSTMREEIPHHPFGKLFKWLPYFESTFLDPLEKNGFHFKTTTNILDVRCPIMIMHAEDDPVIPWTLGEKLYEIALERRDPSYGRVTFHKVPAIARSNHLDITQYSLVPDWISNFLNDVAAFNKKRVEPLLP